MHEIVFVYNQGGTYCSLIYLILVHTISVLMCLLCKKWEYMFTFINVLLELNCFMVSVKKNQKLAFKEGKSETINTVDVSELLCYRYTNQLDGY